MKNEKTKKGISIAIIILLVAVLIVGVWAVAKYTSNITGQGTATVANWSFKVNGSTESITSVALTDTTLNDKVTTGKIAPGTDGSFAIAIDASGSDVALTYNIEISELANFPTNLKFYSDSTFTTPLTESDGNYTFSGNIALADVGTPISQTLYWKWDYETGTDSENIATGDATDVADQGKNATFTVKVTGIQQNPTV